MPNLFFSGDCKGLSHWTTRDNNNRVMHISLNLKLNTRAYLILINKMNTRARIYFLIHLLLAFQNTINIVENGEPIQLAHRVTVSPFGAVMNCRTGKPV